MAIMQKYASLNRKAIAHDILKAMGLWQTDTESFETIHNYIDIDKRILRKGAVSAEKDVILLIPINMRDGSLICRGKGNDEWNRSAPHGAGRLMSRNEAKRSFTLSEYKKSMAGIYTTSVNQSTLDECPMAYKSMQEIIDKIQDTVEVIGVIKPVYNFKAAE
jgi:tRNA-splicing ligase RtcB